MGRQQQAFLKAVLDGQAAVRTAGERIRQAKAGGANPVMMDAVGRENDAALTEARYQRAVAICSALKTGRTDTWSGILRFGKLGPWVEFAPNVSVWATSYPQPGHPAYDAFKPLHEGETVLFMGDFKPSETDCVKDTFVVSDGSTLAKPSFAFDFLAIQKFAP
jgi:hypothetical protein